MGCTITIRQRKTKCRPPVNPAGMWRFLHVKQEKEPEAADREEWESLLSTMQREKAIAYDMNGKYRLNDLVEHTVFGVGIVKLLIRPNKMQVLFQGGKKLLRCSE